VRSSLPTPSPAPSSLAQIRAEQAKELESAAVRDKLFAYTMAEVGGQGDQARQAFMETILNRASARKQSISKTLSGSYFPKATHNKASHGVTDKQRAELQPLLDDVLAGSNITDYATGNASGPEYAFGSSGYFGQGKGRGVTAGFGGEVFGVEEVDVAWANRVSESDVA
jgi:hypothetical protein